MAQYFFKMTNEEKNNILNQHKTIYDGYVTEYGQQTNKQPLYVQDYANDKVGLVVSNKGVVKPYTNMGINESHTGLDMIGDNSEHLTNGTVDLDDYGFNSDNEEYPSPNEDEFEYISLGNINDDDDYDDYADEDYDDKFDKESQEIKRINRDLGKDEDELDEGWDDHKMKRYYDDYNPENFRKIPKTFHPGMEDFEGTELMSRDDEEEFDMFDDIDFSGEVDEDILPEFTEKLNESLDMFKRFKNYN